MRNEIVPCECGNDKLYVAFVMNNLYQVHCQACGNSAPMGYSDNGAVEEWNKKQNQKGVKNG